MDWERVRRLTERQRTYEITTADGGMIFAMYKPSEVEEMKADPFSKIGLGKWRSIRLVGVTG